ncbi:MAG: ABC transporter substrate-binding protein [Spirochaetae bacterium HGW-Spirochaetae-7]|jgi:branched-chain amino acid transport system substrate-binding protein|nr:MAG: ABC transporter substrate-binding protein [Spirochaetae bacterium HGW-Spirochaetae-7]
MKKASAILAILALSVPAFAQSGNIKIGGTWPLGDITGKQGSMAAQQAVDEINAAGGILGRQLELIVIDDELKADKGAAAIEKLVTVDNVDVLMGGMASGVALGQIPAMKKYGKIVISTGAASYKVEEALGADANWYFHLHPWDYNQGASYAQGWDEIQKKYPAIKIKKLFLAYEEGAFGKSSFDQTKILFGEGGRYVVDGAPFKSAAQGGGDYGSMLETAKAFKPDLFLWAGYDADALPMLEQAKAMKFNPGVYLGAPPGWPIGFQNSKLANNVMLYGMWAPSINDISAASKKFYDGFVAKYKAEPATYFAPLSYSAVYVYADAVKLAGTTETNAVIKALEATKYASPLGQTITFTPAKIIKHQGIKNQKILQWQNGRQEVIWPFESATAKPVYPFPKWK